MEITEAAITFFDSDAKLIGGPIKVPDKAHGVRIPLEILPHTAASAALVPEFTMQEFRHLRFGLVHSQLQVVQSHYTSTLIVPAPALAKIRDTVAG